MESSLNTESDQARLGPLHCVGDVVNEQYEIKEVSKYGDGKDAYLCERASDKASLLIECLSLCHISPPNRPDFFHESKMELVESRDKAECPICDSFELHINGDTRFYVVRDVPLPPCNAVEQRSQQQSTSSLEPVVRTGPEGMPCVVYRRGCCHLEIDTPAMGLDHWFCLAMTCCCLPCAIIPIAVFFLAGLIAGIPAMWICSLVALTAAVLMFAYLLIGNACSHTNFVVTSEYFRRKTVLEFRSLFRDSVNHPSLAEAKVTVTDRFFFRQLEGRTACLKEAKIKVTKESDGHETRRVVLEEYSGQTHSLRFAVFYAQQEWLVSEINAVLDNIRRQTERV